MYGHIHIILKDLVMGVAGAEAWASILKEAGLTNEGDEGRALDTVVQSDELTFSLVGATCTVLGLELDKALYTFGRHFVTFALRSGNALLLKSQGATLHAFLANINNLHAHLERDHPNARFPFIESKYDPDQDVAEVTYLSVRSGLKPLVTGVIEEVGLRLYGVNVHFEEVPVPEDLTEAGAAGHAASWRISWRPRPGGPEPLEKLAAGAPQLPKMSFPVLHSAIVDMMRMIRSGNFLDACQCKPEAQKVPTEVTEVAIAGDSDEELSMGRSDSIRKANEVQNRNGMPLEHILMRATRADKVAAAWCDSQLPKCREFWQDSAGRAEDYDLSQDARRVDVFVSHSWSPPENWKIVMGEDLRYADVKSTTLAVMAKDIALSSNQLNTWGEVTFWVDKACIPQDDLMLKESCISLIEKFIHRAQRVCVLFTWSYLERLWCVFEWACVLTDKDPNNIWLMNEMFVTDQSFPLYLECIRHFSLKRTKCFVESDRDILTAKIDECYTSHEDFEHLVRATAIALMARSMAYRAGRSRRLHQVFYEPWLALATELGFTELAAALGSCKPSEWRAAAVCGAPLSKEEGVALPTLLSRQRSLLSVQAGAYHDYINAWFDMTVTPHLIRMRDLVKKSH